MRPKKIFIQEDSFNCLCHYDTSCVELVTKHEKEKSIEYTDLSQVWHEAKEEPKEGTQVVAIDHDGWTGSGLFNPMAMIKGVYLYGELIVDWYSVVRWAYLKDLLPKGGEQ